MHMLINTFIQYMRKHIRTYGHCNKHTYSIYEEVYAHNHKLNNTHTRAPQLV